MRIIDGIKNSSLLKVKMENINRTRLLSDIGAQTQRHTVKYQL